MLKNKLLFIFAVFLITPFSHADLPLSLEDLFTDKGKIKLESSFTYVNSERSHQQFANPIYIQTHQNSFVSVPTSLGHTENNSDIMVGSVGLRYGLTGKTDIYSSMSYLWRNQREFNGLENMKQNSRHFSDASFGINHTFMQDGKNPALMGFVETNLYEKSQGQSSSAKSWTLGLTTYKAIDPIVFSLTGSYRLHLKKKMPDNETFQAGNYWAVNPSVSFAANDKISLTGGVQWLNAQSDKHNGEKISVRTTSTYAHAGVGFGITRDTALNASVRWKVSGQGSAELKLGLTHRF